MFYNDPHIYTMFPHDPNTTNPYTFLGFIQNAGAGASVTRIPEHIPSTAASTDPVNPVLTKDVLINRETHTWARLYLPRPDSSAAPATKLPLILYFHGSGFVFCSAASSLFQKLLSDIALELPAVIVSVEYRLAPEHRLPAAYDDGVEALRWLDAAAADNEWLTAHADLSRCYVMGTSAGGNIAFHVGFREATAAAPAKIKGLILHQPFFGGAEMTPSEIRLADDAVLPAPVVQLMWGLSLPVGADRDHEYCNPMKKEVRVEVLEKMKEQDWKFFITGCDGDPLIDRQMEFAKMMRENGLNVIEEFGEGGFHGIEFVDDSKARILIELLKNFILTS